MQTRILFRQRVSQRRQAGLTLIELMIGLMIGLIVIGAVLYVFLGSRLTYKYNDAMGRIQENGRIAIDMISQDLRMTGFIGCRRLWSYTTTRQIDFSSGFETGIESRLGWEAGSVDITGDGFILNPASAPDDFQLAGTDSLIVLAGATTIPLTQFVASGSTSLTATSAVPLGPAVLSDCRFDEGLSLSEPAPTGIPAPAVGLRVTTAGTTITHDGTLEIEYGPYSGITPITPVSYAVRATGREDSTGNPVLSLFRNDDELIEGVRDLCVRYGDPSGSDDYITAEEVDAAESRDGAEYWREIVGVRIELLLASVDDNTTDAAAPIPILCDRENPEDRDPPEPRPTDRRMYQVFTATVALRNQIVSN